MTFTASKSQRVKNILINKIHSGEFPPGERIYSERKLAEKYNIAKATAAKILEELERDNLIIRKQGKGTFVNDISRITYNIAYLYNRAFPADYPWMTKLLAGMEQNRFYKDFRLHIYGVDTLGESEADLGHIIEDINKGLIDGLLINVEISERVLIFLEQHNVNVVFIENRPRWAGLRYPMIGVDHFQVGYKAVKHLYEQGYRNILAICGLEGPTTSERFRDGFEQALRESGLRWDNRIYHSQWSVDASNRIAIECYERERPDAIVCSDDIQALGVIRARDTLGLTSAEFGVVGVGNLLTVQGNIELTTFQTHIGRIGEIALQKLLDLIESKPIDLLNEYIEPELIERDSTRRER